MRKGLILGVLGLAGVVATAAPAAAYGYGRPVRGHTSQAAFPAVQPPGYYANRYYYGWYYPWYAYYNASHGPYANWQQGGGFATYGGLGHNHPSPQYPGYVGGPHYSGQAGAGHGTAEGATPAEPATEAGTVCVTLPADAKLLFNGAVAAGTGATRTFRTPPLAAGREYAYELTAEVVRDGRTVTATERVVVRPGRETKVTLAPADGVAGR